jgi:CBS domain-containing protein
MRAATEPFLTLTAADLMTAPVTTIPETTPLREAARLLSRSGISGAPVVDANGRCLGVLSSSDFVTWAGKEGEEVSFIAPWGEVVSVNGSPDNEIRHYMTAQPVTVAPGTPIGELAQKMIDAHIHRVLVVEQDRPCGIITSTDILAAVALAARKASLKQKAKPPAGPG